MADPSVVSRAGVSSDEELMSLNDSYDDSLNCEVQFYIWHYHEVDSWVGVKVEKGMSSIRGITPCEVYIAKVLRVDEAGCEVSFLKEKCDGFYLEPEVEVSYPHCQNDTVVLESPHHECRNHIYGFSFPSTLQVNTYLPL